MRAFGIGDQFSIALDDAGRLRFETLKPDPESASGTR